MSMTKKQEEHLLDLLNILKQNSALSHVVVIGSWAEYLYEKSQIIKDFKYVGVTTDADFLIRNLREPSSPVNIVPLAREKGFLYEEDPFHGDSRFVKDDFEVEFLICQQGNGLQKLPTTHLGVNAQQVTHMELLKDNYMSVSFQGFNINVPTPEAYVLQKIIINDRRGIKQEADQEKIARLVPYLDLDEFKNIYAKLNKNDIKKVYAYIEEHFQNLPIYDCINQKNAVETKEPTIKKTPQIPISILANRSDGEPYKNDPEEYRKQTETPFSPRFTIEKWKTETDADKLYTAVLCSNGHINYGRGLEILKAIMENENTPEDALIMVAGGKLDNQGKSMMTNADVISTWEHILNNKNCPAGLAADILLETVMNQNKIEPELAQRILDKAHELLKSKGYSDIAGLTASFQKGDTSNENLLIAVGNIMEKRLPTLLHKSVEDSPNAPGGDMIEEPLEQDTIQLD